MINVLFAGHPTRWPEYQIPLRDAFAKAGLSVDLRTDHAADQVDYIVYAPNSPLQDFTPYTRTKAVLNLWAGVEAIVGNPTLTQPLARMVDFGLRQGMVEWVTGHVLRHHLDIDFDLEHQDGSWTRHIPKLARDRKVTVLGMGELGSACATALATLGFDVTGYSRSPKSHPGIRCLHGADGLDQALTGAEIVVLLLPKTPATENTLNARTLSLLAPGAAIINPGRGPLIDDDALLAALKTGQVSRATLDVFRIEPLPKDHPYWAHPRVTVTPHIASETRPETASEVIAENVRRSEAGQPLLYLVDRALGY
ncbi:glyoxylate/hydroxypyruvate reductase A [Thalassobius vesicularis]|uniref:Glyoxylate/hydroxypyruvate reductase A n=1 Tax=Thalassobius vesicularis TaxID=1294297 RepID=A0A4S3MC58_9RHOB|nr:glyoxylate/hydroxypyruvate reductase A [Thalassobius vesicularis]THD76353.1 glyoxylate/hydroxypyruvate reductase A [Thalassobius vesicularis]